MWAYLQLCLYLCVAACAAWAVHIVVVRPLLFLRLARRRCGLQSAPFRPLLGILWEIERGRARGAPLAPLEDADDALGPTYAATLAWYPVVVTSDRALLHDVFVRKAASFVKPAINALFLRPIVGSGLVASDGPLWRRQRKMIRPAFEHANLAAVGGLFSAHADAFIDGALSPGSLALPGDGAAGGGPGGEEGVSVPLFTSEVTTRFILAAAFGIVDDVPLARSVVRQFRTIVDTHVSRAYKGVGLVPLLRDLPVCGQRAAARELRKLRGLADDIAAGRESGRTASCLPPGGSGKDLLDVLLEARDAETGEAMPRQQVVDELLTFLLAGSDTTSCALAWALYELARHPEAWGRMRAELDARFPSREAGGAAELAALPYLSAVVSETLRLHPPVHMVGRSCAEDVVLRDGAGRSISLPAGTVVAAYIPAANRRGWPRPREFAPEQWQSADRPRGVLPTSTFAAGPRSCIGSRFAEMEARSVLARLCQRYERPELVPGQKIVPNPEIVTGFLHGLRLRFRRRDGDVAT